MLLENAFKYKKTVITIIFLLISALLFISYNKDDKLNPDIKDFLELSKPVNANDGHAVLFALDAPIGADVVTMGHEFINAYLEDPESAKRISSNDFNIETINDDSCIKNIAKCLSQFQNGQLQFNEFSKAELELQKRISIILKNLPLENIFENSFTTPIPDYKYITTYQNQQIKQLINSYISGNEIEVINFLYKDTQIKRQQLSSSGNLIDKMVFTFLIKSNIELLQALSSNKQHHHFLPELTASELNMSSTFSNEYSGYYHLIVDLAEGKHEGGFYTQEKTLLDSILAKVFFKKNRTLNEHFKFISTQYWSPEKDLNEYINTDFSAQFSYNPTFLNYIGDVLNAVGTPAYSKYNFKVMELSCLISQYNNNIGKPKNDSLLNDEQCEFIEKELNDDV